MNEKKKKNKTQLHSIYKELNLDLRTHMRNRQQYDNPSTLQCPHFNNDQNMQIISTRKQRPEKKYRPNGPSRHIQNIPPKTSRVHIFLQHTDLSPG
jgi:hypothetical protein